MSQIIPLFKRVAQNESVNKGGEGRLEKFFTFQIGARIFAVPAVDVAEVTPYSSLIDIPKSSEIVSGVVNVRGTIIPVLNLRSRLGFDSNYKIDDKTKTIFFKAKQDFFIGMVVDDIEYRLRDGIIEPEVVSSITIEGKNFKTVSIEEKDGSYHFPVFFIDELVTASEFDNVQKVLDSF